jgi:hypothetical protein
MATDSRTIGRFLRLISGLCLCGLGSSV